MFFLSAKPLIIFFEIKQSNGGALSPERQCKPSQALTCGVPGCGCALDGFPRICFQGQFGQSRGAVKTSVSSRSRAAWLVPTRNLEIKYRKPTMGRHGTRGGIRSLAPCRPGTVARLNVFPRNSNYFFYPHTSNRWAWATRKIAAKFRVGGRALQRGQPHGCAPQERRSRGRRRAAQGRAEHYGASSRAREDGTILRRSEESRVIHGLQGQRQEATMWRLTKASIVSWLVGVVCGVGMVVVLQRQE
jgi:hypothetical protein